MMNNNLLCLLHVSILAVFQLLCGYNADTRTIPLKEVTFEKICWQDPFSHKETLLKHLNRCNTRINCGIACMSTPNCVVFAFYGRKHKCRLYSGTFTNMTDSCYSKTWDYGYFIL